MVFTGMEITLGTETGENKMKQANYIKQLVPSTADARVRNSCPSMFQSLRQQLACHASISYHVTHANCCQRYSMSVAAVCTVLKLRKNILIPILSNKFLVYHSVNVIVKVLKKKANLAFPLTAIPN